LRPAGRGVYTRDCARYVRAGVVTMQQTRSIVALAVLAFPLLFTPAAGQVSIGVYEDPAGLDCHAYPPPPNIVSTYYVVARQRAGGIAGVRFSAPLPACLGATWVEETSPFTGITGDSQTGVTIDFGGCVGANAILLLSLHVIHAPGAGTACCLMEILPDPAEPSGDVIYMSCDSYQHPAHARVAWLNEDHTCEIQQPPRSPSPANNTAGVAAPVVLSWASPLPLWCEEPAYNLEHTVYLGTSPDPPMIADHVQPPLNAGPLLPGTTYYWKVYAYTGISSATSQVWTFTTAPAVGAHTSTWGGIKALFR